MTAKSRWQAIDTDDFVLRRYGMLAHVERMSRSHWWFSISRDGQREDLYNTANNLVAVKLKDKATAMDAAECCMELLRGIKANADRAGADVEETA